jgi:hypothetical protein
MLVSGGPVSHRYFFSKHCSKLQKKGGFSEAEERENWSWPFYKILVLKYD